jgi:hypothetical protein
MSTKPRASLANPYIVGLPAKKYFVDRDDLLDEMEVNIGTPSPTRQNYAIVGPRQIGKTSLVLRLQERLYSRMPVSYLTLQAIPDRNEGSMYQELLKPVKKQLKEAGCSSLMTDWLTDDHTSAFRFNEDMEALNRAVLATPSIPRVVFIIDEAEILQEIGGPSFLGFLRSIMQNLVGLAFVVVGSQSLSRMVQDYTSPFYNVFLPRSVQRLPERAARELVRRPAQEEWGITFADDAVERIVHQTGKHPHLIQLLCYEISEYLRKRPEITLVDDELVRDVATKLVEDWVPDLEHGDYFSGIWEVDPRSRLVMLILAHADKPVRFGEVSREAGRYLEDTDIRLKTEEIARALDDLESRLAVFKEKTSMPWKRYLLSNDLLGNWIRAKCDMGRVIEEIRVPKVRVAEVSPAENLRALERVIQQRQEQIEFLTTRLAEPIMGTVERAALSKSLETERRLLEDDLSRKKELEALAEKAELIPPEIDVFTLPETVREQVASLLNRIERVRDILSTMQEELTLTTSLDQKVLLDRRESNYRKELADLQSELQQIIASASTTVEVAPGEFDYKRGIDAFRVILQLKEPSALPELLSLEARLLENLAQERRFGTTEMIRLERARIVDSLNRLALRLNLGMSFNDLAKGVIPE